MSLGKLNDVPLACPACTSPLCSTGNDIRCLSCDNTYARALGVPVLLQGGEWTSVRNVQLSKAGKLLEILGLPRNRQTIKVAAKILGGRLCHPSGYLSTESSQFVARVKSSLPGTWPIELDTLLPPVGSNKSTEINKLDQIRFEFTSSYLPENLPVEAVLSANFRLKNIGGTVISSCGDRRVVASGHWLTETGEEETLRTELLVDLAPDAELTFPILFQTPKTPGQYRFRPSLLIEGAAWILGKQEFPIRIGSRPSVSKTFPQFPTKSSYNEDHLEAIGLLKKWSSEFSRNAVVVELGGNFSPSFGTVFQNFVNVDIDLSGLQFAAIRNDGITNICADGLALPFSDHSIDIFGMFATLHHFPDPVALLRQIKRKLKPHGRIALMCEPVGHVFRQTMYDEYLLELMKGVNEQSFSELEYVEIFKHSGFRTREVVMHGSSLKAWLEPVN
jgi:hypothetical protein